MKSVADFNDPKIGPNLRPILVSNELLSRSSLFERKDAEAVAEQKWLFRLLAWINGVVLAIAILSGTVLAISVYRPDVPEWTGRLETVSKWLAGLIGLLAIVATVLGQLARDGDRLGRWRTLRAEAEAARAGRFAALARSAAAAGKAAAREALEFVRLGLLEDQRSWYLSRASRHRQSERVTSSCTAVALFLAAIASAAALTVSFGGLTAALLVVGVLAAAFTAYAVDRENLYRDRSNAALYERTAEQLGALAAGSDAVLTEIDRGHPEAVVTFTDLVAEQLLAEHRQWAAGLDVTSELMTRLEQRLQQARATEPARRVGGITPDETRSELRKVSLPDPGTSITMVSPEPSSVPSLVSNLRQWAPLLTAATSALPPEQADRARTLLAELSGVLAPLDSAAPASSAIQAAANLADRLKADNPLGQWFKSTQPQMASVLGTVLPPLSLVLGIAGVGAQLGEAAYRRWVSRVLQTPFSPGLVEPKPDNTTVILAALEVSPIFAAAFTAERKAGNLAAISQVGDLVLTDPEQLWATNSAKFGGDRGRFDQGVEEMRRALLDDAVGDDLQAVSSGKLPAGTTPGVIVDAAAKLNASPNSQAALQTTVQLLHELRNEGVADPLAALQAALTEGRRP